MKINLALLNKIFIAAILSIISIFIALFAFYILFLPKVAESKFVKNEISKIAKKEFNIEIDASDIKLKTYLKPLIRLEIDRFAVLKNKNTILELKDFKSEICFENIFNKKINLNELKFQKLSLDVNKIIEILPKENSKKQNSPIDYSFTFNNSDIQFDDVDINYAQNDKTFTNLKIKNIKLIDKKQFGQLLFDLKATIANDKIVNNLTVCAKDEIKITNNEIGVKNLSAKINNSSLKLNSKINDKNIYLNAKSDKFYLSDVFELVNSNLFISNGSQLLAPLKNPKGNISFDVSLNNQDLSGEIDVNNTGVEIKDVSYIPIYVSKGKILISKDKIDFKNLIGYYGKNKSNKIEIKGDIKDYYKTFDSNIEIESVITNEFFKDYLAKLINNTVLIVSKPSRTKVIYKSKNNIMDIIWFAQISKGVNFGVSDEKSALSDYDRAVLGEFQIKDEKIDIKNINYYIASNIVRGVKLQPILQANALMDFNGKLDKAGLAFGREMPCEFLNVFLGQKLFMRGTIKGNINVVFKNDIPYLDADMEIKKTLIPSQRLAIKEANLKTSNNLINIDAQGRFKRATYIFKGKIKNELKPPFIIKNLALEIDNLDVERILNSFNNANTNNSELNEQQISSEEDLVNNDDDFMFDTNLIRIEDCDFKLAKGNYKELTFGNIVANLTLDEKGILNIQSNKFDIAQGISTLKVVCDLKKLQYYIRLGVKDIDSNLMTKTLFNLDKEISGKATGLIELFGDKTLKLNGDIKFVINEGTIGKIGLVEYVLKIASVFRNPIVMVSPVTIMDIISIPEGKFDKIQGTIKIKDNVLAPIDIKSYSSSLSALIKGKFDLERHDASLRIYTRFSTDKKTIFGFLRNLSLNSLANKVKLNSKNDANYYESELSQLPQIDVEENKTQVFLTQVEGDIEHFNFLSSLKKVK